MGQYRPRQQGRQHARQKARPADSGVVLLPSRKRGPADLLRSFRDLIFVRVLDERTIAFPSWDGNGMYLSAGNLLENPNVGLLFIDSQRQHRLRLNGVATIDEGDPLLAEFP